MISVMASGGVATTNVPMVEPDQWLEMGGLPPTAPPVTLLWASIEIAGEDAGVVRQGEVDRAAIGNGGGVDGAAGQARVGAVQRVIGGGVGFDGRRGDGEREPGGDGAAVAAEDRRAEEIGVNEVGAVRQPFLEEVDFALVGAGERVGVAVGGNGAGPGADGILGTPAAGFAGLGLGQLAAEVGDDGEDMVGGEGGAAQVGPAIDPALPEVGVGEEALPPADALQGRIAEVVGALVAAGLHNTRGGD